MHATIGRIARWLGSTTLVLGFLVGGGLVTPLPVGARAPECFKEQATINDHSGEIVGTNGDDVIIGDGGNNRINGRGGNDRICSGGGNDVVNAGPGGDYVNGGSGHDDLYGSSGSDWLYGQSGDDVLDGGTGPGLVLDSCSGGPGNDSVVSCFP